MVRGAVPARSSTARSPAARGGWVAGVAVGAAMAGVGGRHLPSSWGSSWQSTASAVLRPLERLWEKAAPAGRGSFVPDLHRPCAPMHCAPHPRARLIPVCPLSLCPNAPCTPSLCTPVPLHPLVPVHPCPSISTSPRPSPMASPSVRLWIPSPSTTIQTTSVALGLGGSVGPWECPWECPWGLSSSSGSSAVRCRSSAPAAEEMRGGCRGRGRGRYGVQGGLTSS